MALRGVAAASFFCGGGILEQVCSSSIANPKENQDWEFITAHKILHSITAAFCFWAIKNKEKHTEHYGSIFVNLWKLRPESKFIFRRDPTLESLISSMLKQLSWLIFADVVVGDQQEHGQVILCEFFYPLVGGHLTFEKVTYCNHQGHFESPGDDVFLLTRKFRYWLIGGLGPGGLDSWDPLLKGIVT